MKIYLYDPIRAMNTMGYGQISIYEVSFQICIIFRFLTIQHTPPDGIWTKYILINLDIY